VLAFIYGTVVSSLIADYCGAVEYRDAVYLTELAPLDSATIDLPGRNAGAI
jgi:hypothetical protein